MKKTTAVLMALLLTMALAMPAFADPLPALYTPTVAVLSNTDETITLRVTAGAAPGAPAGFTLHWMPLPTSWSGVWPSSGYNEAVFDGTATSSPFALGAGGTVDVVVGAFDSRATVAYNPATGILPLAHQTAYVFRVKANGVAATYEQSAWSASVSGVTTTTLSTPAVAIVTSATTNNTLTVRVTAGSTAPGAPAGLTLHWMPVPTSWSGTWPTSGYNVAVFDGTATSSPFALAAGGTIDVVVGAFDSRPTVSYVPASGILPLQQGTAYAFRVESNAVGTTYDASAYSATVTGATAGGQSGGTTGEGADQAKGKGKGYYKNHLDWPGTQLPTQTFFFSGMTWAEILKAAPKGGDTYVKLAQSYVTTMLRIASGKTPSAGVTTILNSATTWFASPSHVPGVKANTVQGKTLLHWAAVLSSWNEQMVAPSP